jgi:hypothetical protein
VNRPYARRARAADATYLRVLRRRQARRLSVVGACQVTRTPVESRIADPLWRRLQNPCSQGGSSCTGYRCTQTGARTTCFAHVVGAGRWAAAAGRSAGRTASQPRSRSRSDRGPSTRHHGVSGPRSSPREASRPIVSLMDRSPGAPSWDPRVASASTMRNARYETIADQQRRSLPMLSTKGPAIASTSARASCLRAHRRPRDRRGRGPPTPRPTIGFAQMDEQCHSVSTPRAPQLPGRSRRCRDTIAWCSRR